MKIVISMGDCNGIGLEAFIKAIYFNIEYFEKNENKISFELAGNTRTITEYISLLKLNAKIEANHLIIKNQVCKIVDIAEYSKIEFGVGTLSSGKLAAKSIEYSVDSTIEGKYDTILTLPVSKNALYLAGWQFPGHTEMLAKKCDVKEPLMILFKDNFRVALLTIHLPLSKVPTAITKKRLLIIANQFYHSLIYDFGICSPKIAVLGLNPHSGENGALGKEELSKIIPALSELRTHNVLLEGPFPADGFFAHNWTDTYDGVIAMYHDQGLIPLKQYSKGTGVNFTAGLPIVRTSPAHGTAFDIAGKGLAKWTSTFDAICSAVNIVNNRRRAAPFHL